jgi:hypothetical protein
VDPRALSGAARYFGLDGDRWWKRWLQRYPHPTRRTKRSIAWVYYYSLLTTLVGADSVIVSTRSPRTGVIGLALAGLLGLYARYLFRGGRIVVWWSSGSVIELPGCEITAPVPVEDVCAGSHARYLIWSVGRDGDDGLQTVRAPQTHVATRFIRPCLVRPSCACILQHPIRQRPPASLRGCDAAAVDRSPSSSRSVESPRLESPLAIWWHRAS